MSVTNCGHFLFQVIVVNRKIGGTLTDGRETVVSLPMVVAMVIIIIDSTHWMNVAGCAD